jgi:hypothetical protein
MVDVSPALTYTGWVELIVIGGAIGGFGKS